MAGTSSRQALPGQVVRIKDRLPQADFPFVIPPPRGLVPNGRRSIQSGRPISGRNLSELQAPLSGLAMADQPVMWTVTSESLAIWSVVSQYGVTGLRYFRILPSGKQPPGAIGQKNH